MSSETQAGKPVYSFLRDTFANGLIVPGPDDAVPEIDLIRIDVYGRPPSAVAYAIWVKSGKFITYAGDLCLDEFLGSLARLLFVPNCNRIPIGDYEPYRRLDKFTFLMESVGAFRDDWNIRSGDRFSGQIQKDEAFASVIHFIFTGNWMYHGLRPYSAHVAGSKWLQEKPIALLNAPSQTQEEVML